VINVSVEYIKKCDGRMYFVIGVHNISDDNRYKK